MKLRIITLLALLLPFFTTNIQAQVAYPHFQKHIVLEGETAQSIANYFNVSLQDFCLLNDFPVNVKLKPNQEVLIKQLKDGEKEIVEDSQFKKTTPAKTEPAKTEPVKTVVEEKSKSTTTTTKTTTITEKPKPVAEEKPVPSKTTAVEKPKPVVTKKEVAEEPFVVPPPSAKAVEVGPGGTVYNVSKSEYHTVAKGQTFFRIALIYGLSVEELKDLNGMSNTNIAVGQKLKVRK